MIIQKLREQKNFSSVEKEIANYVLEHSDQIINMSIRDLARQTYSSPSTILRLCKKINVNGYQDFRIAFNSEIHSEIYSKQVNEDIPFGDSDSFQNIASNIATINMRGIQDTLNALNINEMQEIVQKFKEASTIDIYGDGSSLLSASEFRLKMLRLGVNVHIEENFSNQCYQAVNATHDHVVIIISHSGESLNCTKILKILKRKSIFCVAITSNPESSIAKQCDYVIQNGSYENQYLNSKLEMYSSHISVHYILDCLYSFYYMLDYQKNLEQARKKESIIRMYSTDKNINS